jgi:hypothetical protein
MAGTVNGIPLLLRIKLGQEKQVIVTIFSTVHPRG